PPRRATLVHRGRHAFSRRAYVDLNSLRRNIQPYERISISFGATLPGPEMRIKSVSMDFCYRPGFGAGSRSAYATLLNDCRRGDATLFDRADSVEAAWALVDPILNVWRDSAPTFPN